MEDIVILLIGFLILFIILFLGDYIFVNRKYYKKLNDKEKNKNNPEPVELSYLIGKFKLNREVLPLKKVLIVISLLDGFIISFVTMVIIVFKINIILKLVIGFVLLMALIYAIYELYGRLLVKKGYGKNGL